MQIKIDHIAKIEGHAGFTADIADGNIQKARIDVQEGARLLEGILRDRSIFEVSQITARICGVCPVVHMLTSLKALEKALRVEVSEQTILLRKLMMMGQVINSHALHLFFFSLSDFFGIEDDLKLIKKFPKRAHDALLIREFGNRLIEVIGGRSIHPLTPAIGGFLKLPDRQKLGELFDQCDEILAATKKIANLFINLDYPNFFRSAPFISVVGLKEYAIYDGQIKMSDNEHCSPENFFNLITETQIKNSLVKNAQYRGKTFFVGAIARINNSHAYLNPEAKKALKSAKLILPSLNPFHNILAQAVEIIHCVEETQKLLHKFLRQHPEEQNERKTKIAIEASLAHIKYASRGAAAMEAPRGTIHYFYEIGPDRKVKNCNIITPTSQNLARIEEDLAEYLPKILGKKNVCLKSACADKIKMLVRAYDPCLTCATH